MDIPLDTFISSPDALLNQFQQQQQVDDYISYQLYVDDDHPQATDASFLQEVANKVMAITSTYRQAYIWHFEAFSLEVISPPNTNVKPHLTGRTKVGENIEDEWLVVWLLLQATADPGLCQLGLAANVLDADGHFLLIEAAASLPSWLGPEDSDYRLWIRGGTFHLLTLQHHPDNLPSAEVAMKILKRSQSSSSISTTAAPWLHQALHPRLSVYPAKIEADKHRACCLVPLGIAHVLHRRPELIANAVRALRTRDPGELTGPCASMRRFPLSPLVPVRLTFSKYLYGQLEFDEVQPPKPFMLALAKAGGPSARGASRGIRLACGMEMMYWRSTKEAEEDEAARGGGWLAYVARLRQKGLFDGVLEGSTAYRTRMHQAEKAFASASTASTTPSTNQSIEAAALAKGEGNAGVHEVVDALLQEEYNIDHFPPKETIPPDDDDSWLEVHPDELEAILKRYGQEVDTSADADGKEEEEESEEGQEEGELEDAGGEDLDEILEGMKTFMGTISGLEGAEVPLSSKQHVGAAGGKGVNFKVDQLLEILKATGTAGGAKQRQGGDDMMLSDDDDEAEEEKEEEEEDWDDVEDGEKEEDAIDLEGRRVQEGKVMEKQTAEGGILNGVYVRQVMAREVMDSDDEDEEEADVTSTAKARDQKEGGPSMIDYMNELDRELMGTTLNQSFQRFPPPPPVQEGETSPGGDEGDEEFRPVDVDLNLVKNLLESYSSQGGLPGPASNLLGELKGLSIK